MKGEDSIMSGVVPGAGETEGSLPVAPETVTVSEPKAVASKASAVFTVTSLTGGALKVQGTLASPSAVVAAGFPLASPMEGTRVKYYLATVTTRVLAVVRSDKAGVTKVTKKRVKATGTKPSRVAKAKGA